MKKKNIFILLSSLLLVGCTNETPAPAPIIKEESPIQKGLNTLREGFTFTGTLERTRTYYTSSSFITPIDPSQFSESDLKATSNFTFTFGNNSYYRKVEEYNAISEGFETYVEDTYFADEKGRIYSETLTAANEIGRDYKKNGANNVTFEGGGYDNPFFYILEKDIIKNEDNSYSLNIDKASFIFNRLCGFYASGAQNGPKECSITLNEDSLITRITYSPKIRYVAEYDSTQDTYYFYTVDQVYDFYIVDAGKDKVKHIEKEAQKGASNLALKKAIENFDGSNVTLVATDTDLSSEIPSSKTKVSYLDGKNAYIKYFDSSRNGSETSLNVDYDYVLTKNPKLPYYEARIYENDLWIPSNKTRFGKVNQDKYTYIDLIPHIKGISSDLFTYDSASDSYICENEAVSELGRNYFQSSAIELQMTNAHYANKITIQLNSEDQIKTVTVDYKYADFFSASLITTGQIVYRYQKAGSTVLPFDASSKLGE